MQALVKALEVPAFSKIVEEKLLKQKPKNIRKENKKNDGY